MTRVDLTGLTRLWPGAATPALDGLTLGVPAGALVALLGPSGCGKTTVLRLIAGLLDPTAGEIAFDGRSVLGDPPERRGAVMVFQNHLLFPHLTVAGNIGFGLRMRRRPAAEIASRVTAMLDLVQLSGLGPRGPAQLSGGQQQRVALARALILQPRVLLLDEPLSNLDPHLRVEMRELIRDIRRDLPVTTLFVTHDQEEAAMMGDRIALILAGRLRQYDPPEAFFRRPADAAVAAFLGVRNLLPGRVVSGGFEGPFGRLTLAAGAPEGPGLLTVRPEAVRLGPASVNALAAVVAGRSYLGSRTRLSLRVGPAVIDADLPPDLAEGVGPGDSLTIHLPPAALWVMPPR